VAASYTTWLPVDAGADVLGLLPAPHQQLRALQASFVRAGLDPALLESCRTHMDALVRGAPSPVTANGSMSDGERAAVGFAEQFVLDPRGVTDAQVDELHRLFPAPQLAALTTAVATFDAVARVKAVLADPAGTPARVDLPLAEEE
jgi:alkylhydroperoxidase family enzyme